MVARTPVPEVSDEEFEKMLESLEAPAPVAPIKKRKLMPKKRKPLKVISDEEVLIAVDTSTNTIRDKPDPVSTSDKPQTESEEAGSW